RSPGTSSPSSMAGRSKSIAGSASSLNSRSACRVPDRPPCSRFLSDWPRENRSEKGGMKTCPAAPAECPLSFQLKALRREGAEWRGPPIPAVRGTELDRQGSLRVIRRLPVIWQYGALGGRRLISLEGIE